MARAAKRFYMQFNCGDWLKDPKLSLCSPATRGIWMDLLCAMHENDRCGQITGKPEQIARLCRCTTVDLVSALEELAETKAADATKRHADVTIINRRMRNDYLERKSVTLRKKRSRSRKGHGDVTPKSHPPNSELDLSPPKAPPSRAGPKTNGKGGPADGLHRLSLGALRVHKQELSTQLEDLRNPGGSAHPKPLEGKAAERAVMLRQEIRACDARIKKLLSEE